MSDVEYIPTEAWSTTDVVAVMTPMPLTLVTVDADLESALAVMVANGLSQVPVVQGDKLAGMLSRADVLTYMRWMNELHVRQSAPASSVLAATDGTAWSR